MIKIANAPCSWGALEFVFQGKPAPYDLVLDEMKGWDYFKSVEKGVFCELGAGAVDFPAIKCELEKQGYDDWIVVGQDVLPGTGTPKESAKRNRLYLKSIGL